MKSVPGRGDITRLRVLFTTMDINYQNTNIDTVYVAIFMSYTSILHIILFLIPPNSDLGAFGQYMIHFFIFGL